MVAHPHVEFCGVSDLARGNGPSINNEQVLGHGLAIKPGTKT